MTISRVAVSSVLPIPLEVVKSRLQIETDDLDEQGTAQTNDAVLSAFMAAIDYVEKQTHLVLRPTIFRLDSRSWCLVSECGPRRCQCCQPLLLQRAPFASVSEIEYLGSGELTYDVLPAEEYTTQRLSDGGLIHLNDGVSLPSIGSRWNAVQVTFVAGFGNYNDPVPFGDGATFADEAGFAGQQSPDFDLPPALAQALMLLTGHWFNNRDAVGTERAYEVPIGADDLLVTFRQYR